MTLVEHAEVWQQERGRPVPPRNTTEWRAMYEEWIRFAFAHFDAFTASTPAAVGMISADQPNEIPEKRREVCRDGPDAAAARARFYRANAFQMPIHR
jgi:hypothetical protein